MTNPKSRVSASLPEREEGKRGGGEGIEPASTPSSHLWLNKATLSCLSGRVIAEPCAEMRALRTALFWNGVAAQVAARLSMRPREAEKCRLSHVSPRRCQ